MALHNILIEHSRTDVYKLRICDTHTHKHTLTCYMCTHAHTHTHTTDEFREKNRGHSPLTAISKIQKIQCIDI